MSAIDQLFLKLRSENRKALMPFITAGDPDLDTTWEAICRFDAIGCHLCEVGVPYSDPIADGPVIQASYTRALEKKIKVSQILSGLSTIKNRLTMPRVTMVSYAIIYRYGLEKFVADAQAAGVSGAIVPDLLVEEAEAFSKICRKADFSLIQLVTPTTPRDRAVRIAESSSGFLYYVSVTGITGERTELPKDLAENVSWLRTQTPLPICIGFGINKPEHVRLLAPVADGLIVGSAVVKRIAEAMGPRRLEVLEDTDAYLRELMAAL